jgi:alpha-glucan,water dikinase
LKNKLPAWVKQPASLAMPFGAFEKVLALDENKEATQEYQRRLKELGQASNPETLLAVRQAVGRLGALTV